MSDFEKINPKWTESSIMIHPSIHSFHYFKVVIKHIFLMLFWFRQLNPIPDDRCCYVQLSNVNDFKTLLQLDGQIIRSSIIRITPAAPYSNLSSYSPNSVDTLQNPFENHFTPSFSINHSNQFHVEPFISNINPTSDYDLPPGLRSISQPFIRSDKEFSFQNNLSNGQETSSFVSLPSPFHLPFSQHVPYSLEQVRNRFVDIGFLFLLYNQFFLSIRMMLECQTFYTIHLIQVKIILWRNVSNNKIYYKTLYLYFFEVFHSNTYQEFPKISTSFSSSKKPV